MKRVSKALAGRGGKANKRKMLLRKQEERRLAANAAIRSKKPESAPALKLSSQPSPAEDRDIREALPEPTPEPTPSWSMDNTKAELVEAAESMGIEVKSGMTKSDILAEIRS